METLEKPTRSEVIAGTAATVGPSALLDLAWGLGTVLTAACAFGRAGRRRLRALRWAGSLLSLAPWAYLLARPWILHWGATSEEVLRPLPGDEIVPNPVGESTRAITIDAPAGDVWPWLIQIGYGRAGWYSYDRLERAAKAGDFYEGHSAEHVLPQFQRLEVGDVVRMTRWTGMRVAYVEPPRALVLQSLVDSEVPVWGMSTWAFVLEAVAEDRARLLVRGRTGHDPRKVNARILNHLIELPHFVMERKMMRGLKERAERPVRVRAQA